MTRLNRCLSKLENGADRAGGVAFMVINPANGDTAESAWARCIKDNPNAANAIFAAITGVSIASLAVFTKVAVPKMLRFGYRPRFAVGVVADSSVLGMPIPPPSLIP